MTSSSALTYVAAVAGVAGISALTIVLPLAVVQAARSQPDTVSSQPSPQAEQAPNPWEVCQACHDEVVTSFGPSAHGKAARFLSGTRAATCESCHGDPAKHLETPEVGNITNPAKLSAPLASETCLTCHVKDTHRATWRGGPHESAALGCLSCHSVHHSAESSSLLIKRTEEDLCFTCHADQRRAFHQRSTHLIRTEHRAVKVGCNSCHNPHGGETSAQLRALSTNDLCYTCHAQTRGPFLWEHVPVREDCLNCHTPHGSNNPALLKARANLLCQQCHVNLLPRHQTLAGRATDVWTINRGCLNCHSQVHGSNHPSGKTFTR